MASRSHELERDFHTEVLEVSNEIPVVVDFWAAWCAPCRMLGPVLEKLAAESAGRWRLVKVDTEAHGELAQQYDIRGIPAVKMFHLGRPVAEFVGALPEAQVRDWLQQNLPGVNRAELEAAVAAQERGDVRKAQQLLEKIVEEDPQDQSAKLRLARVLLELDPRRAQSLAAEIPAGVSEHAMAEHIQVLSRLLAWVNDAGQDIAIDTSKTSPENLERYRDAAVALSDKRYEIALEHWIDLLQRDRTLDNDGPRRACIALFALLGEDNDITKTYRRRFSMALH